MTGNKIDPRQAEKLAERAIDAYALGGCPFCGTFPEDFAPYTIGTDALGQTIACCNACADGRIVSPLRIGVKMPDDQGTQWSVHDKAFFELHPERRLHVRKPWKMEAEVLSSHRAGPVEGVPCNAVLVVQLAPGKRASILCPFLNVERADEAGDEAIAAQTVHSVPELIEKIASLVKTRLEAGSSLKEAELALAWRAPFNDRPWKTHAPASRTQ